MQGSRNAKKIRLCSVAHQHSKMPCAEFAKNRGKDFYDSWFFKKSKTEKNKLLKNRQLAVPCMF